MNYETYCDQMAKFNSIPMSESDFNIMQDIDKKREEPLVIVPKIKVLKMAKEFKEPKEKVVKPKPFTVIREKQQKIEKEYKSNRARPTDLNGLSKEEKAEYHKKKALERYYRNRSPNVRTKMSNEERLEKRRVYNNKRRQAMIEAGTWKRKPLTQEQKDHYRKLKEIARRKAGIKPREKMSEEEFKKRKLEISRKSREKQKAQGKKRILTDEQRERYNANQRARAKLLKEEKNV